jgi:putative transposase
VKYACIEAHRREFSIAMMCRVLGVSRAGYYAFRERAPRKRAAQQGRLRVEVEQVFQASHQRYGSPRVYRELLARGIRCGLRQVAELMRRAELRARPRRRFVVTTQSSPAANAAPNLVQRQFSVGVINRVWVADITYLWTQEGWLYLAVVQDLGSRRIVGWKIQTTLELPLAKGAMEAAIWQRRPTAGLIHHSDRGVHYTSPQYRAMLDRHEFRSSMSRKGDCWDNAVAESFFATLKKELQGARTWATRAEARRDVFEYIEMWYNPKRRHSSLGYRSPIEYEAALALIPRAA